MGLLTPRVRTALTAALVAQRLAEVVHSTQNVRRAGPGTRAAPRSFPLMVAVNLAGGAACLLANRRRRDPPLVVEAAALAGLGFATLLRLWVIRVLGPAWNVQALVAARTRVVTRGPYRLIRHPNYVAVALEFACLPLALGAYTEAAVFTAANAAVLVPRIHDEEALLDGLPGYRLAFSGVPRFIPRPGRTSRPVPQLPATSTSTNTTTTTTPKLR